MNVHLVVLLVPGFHLAPLESDMARQVGLAGRRVAECIGCVFGAGLSHPDVPELSFAPPPAIGLAIARLQQIRANVAFREIIDWNSPRLRQEHHRLAVGYHLFVEQHPHPPWAGDELTMPIRHGFSPEETGVAAFRRASRAVKTPAFSPPRGGPD